MERCLQTEHLPLRVESHLDGTLRRRLQVPILMYHYVSELPSDADATRVG